MLDILTASPCPESFGVEPLSVADIDAHTDAPRIWRTIDLLRGILDVDREVEVQAAYNEGIIEGENLMLAMEKSVRDGLDEIVKIIDAGDLDVAVMKEVISEIRTAL